MSIEEKITSVEGSISNLQNSMISRLNKIREGQGSTTFLLWVGIMYVSLQNGCISNGLNKKIDALQQAQIVYEENLPGQTLPNKYYTIDGKKAYITIEGKPSEQYMKEKKNE